MRLHFFIVRGRQFLVAADVGCFPHRQETRSNHKGFHAVSREVAQLVNTVDRAMSKVQHDIEEIPSNDPRRHALVDGLRGSSKLETRVTQLFKYVVCYCWRRNDG